MIARRICTFFLVYLELIRSRFSLELKYLDEFFKVNDPRQLNERSTFSLFSSDKKAFWYTVLPKTISLVWKSIVLFFKLVK